MRTFVQRVAAGFILAVAVAVPVGGTSIHSASVIPQQLTVLSPGDDLVMGPAIVSGAFGLKLLDAVSDHGRDNALVSPVGVGAVLAMLSQGAKEPVRRAIQDMFAAGTSGAEDTTTDAERADSAGGTDQGKPDAGAPAAYEPYGRDAATALAHRLGVVLAAAEHDEGVDVEIANAMFARRDLDLFPALSVVLDDWFQARVERLDFAGESAVARINTWVSEATGGLIPRLVQQLEPDDVLVLTNAMHFQGEWTRRFDPERTVPVPFHLRSGAVPEVPAMHADNLPGRYREDDDFQALALPYGDGGFELVVVLPRAGVESAEALRRLASDPSWLGERGFSRARGSVSLPRLSLLEEASLLPALRALGLGPALDDAQAFAGIAAPAPRLSRVLHRATLVLDERGTEAAAATAAVMTTRSAVIERAFDVRVDRPFALALRHRNSGEALFAAWIEDPTQAAESSSR